MLNTILSYFTEGNTFNALEICEINSIEFYNLLEVKKSKGEINITKNTTFSNFDEFSKYAPENTPLFLSINTSQVLTKKLSNTSNTNPKAIVNSAFPNLDTSNFYYEITKLFQEPIVAIAKKEYIDGVLKKLNDTKIPLIEFSLGVNSISAITSYFEEKTTIGSNFQLIPQENTLNFITEKPLEHQYELNGLQIKNTHLLPLANIIGYLSQKSTTSNFTSLNDSYTSIYKNSRVFTTVLKSFLVFFIGVLLINFFFFSHYHSTTQNLSTLVDANSSQKNSLNTLNVSVTKKQERLKVLSTSSNSITTYYFDQLGSKTPSTVLLNEIEYQPLLKPIRNSKPIDIEVGTILVSGISYDDNEFSIWLEKLDDLKWISIVKTIDYDYVSKNASHFIIKIELHED